MSSTMEDTNSTYGSYEDTTNYSASSQLEFSKTSDYYDYVLYKTAGPIRDPLYVVVPISILYASIFISGTIGNISTCVVIARNKSMHTATNYYLFSLAVSDLLLLVSGMPVEMWQVWCKYPYIFGETFCVLRGLAAETSSNASVLTITAFTAERYVAICHPFLSQTMSKLSRAIKLILFVWLIAFLCALPLALQFGLVPISQYGRPSDVMCLPMYEWSTLSFAVSSLVFFVVPMTVIVLLYVLIGVKLKKSTMISRNRSQSRRMRGRTVANQRMDRHSRPTRSTRRVLKMLVAVVVAFFICWAPFHMQRLLYFLVEHSKTSEDSWMQSLSKNESFKNYILILTYLSGVFYYVSTTINPILYNIMSNKFREAFVETLARSCRMSKLMSPRMRRSYSSLSRSQQRNPGNCVSKTTGVGSGGMAQESTDCSGNSCRDDFPMDRGLDYSTSESPPLPLLYTSSSGSRQSSKKDIITIELGNGNDNGSSLSVNQSKAAGRPIGFHFVELSRDQRNRAMQYDDDDRDFGSSEYEVYTKFKRSTESQPTQKSYQPSYVNNVQTKGDNKKKWWNLLNWIPGIKSLRNSRQALSSQTSNIIVDQNQRLNKQQRDDYFVQMQTFKVNNDTCRPT